MAQQKSENFKRKARATLTPEQPASIAEFLSNDTQLGQAGTESQKDGKTEIRQTRKTENTEDGETGGKVREDLRLPADLGGTLREYAHQHHMKKTAVVIEALEEYFKTRNFSLP